MLERYKKELSDKGYSLNDSDPIFIAYKQKGKVKRMSPVNIYTFVKEACKRAWHDKKSVVSPQD